MRCFLLILSLVGFVQAQELVPTEPTVADRVLVISAEANNPSLELLRTGLEASELAYDTLIAKQQELTATTLIAADGTGNYDAIILTEGGLGFQNGEVWESAFGDEEWAQLWAYQRDYSVRQVALYLYPSSYPEDYGLNRVAVRDTGKFPSPVVATKDASKVFSLPQEDLTIRGAYMYLAQVDPATDNKVTPLLETASGNTVAALSVTPDGRERLAFTMAQGPGLEHSELLTAAALDWTRGLLPAALPAPTLQVQLLDLVQRYTLPLLLALLALLGLLLLLRLRANRQSALAFEPNPANSMEVVTEDKPNEEPKLSIYSLRSQQKS